MAHVIRRGKSLPVGMVDGSRIKKSLGCIDGSKKGSPVGIVDGSRIRK